MSAHSFRDDEARATFATLHGAQLSLGECDTLFVYALPLSGFQLVARALGRAVSAPTEPPPAYELRASADTERKSPCLGPASHALRVKENAVEKPASRQLNGRRKLFSPWERRESHRQ
jgi:hypothetical protein